MSVIKAFILEDSEERAKTFRSALEGWDITLCSACVDALKHIMETKFDIIFLDHDLGGKVFVPQTDKEASGYPVAQAIPGSINKETPVVVHSWNIPAAKSMVEAIGETAQGAAFGMFDLKKFKDDFEQLINKEVGPRNPDDHRDGRGDFATSEGGLMNTIVVLGNVVKDAVLKYTEKSTAVLTFDIASNDFRGKNKVVTFFNVKVWGKRAETLNEMVKKGQSVLVSGKFFGDRFKTKEQKWFTNRLIEADTVELISRNPAPNSDGRQSAEPATSEEETPPANESEKEFSVPED